MVFRARYMFRLWLCEIRTIHCYAIFGVNIFRKGEGGGLIFCLKYEIALNKECGFANMRYMIPIMCAYRAQDLGYMWLLLVLYNNTTHAFMYQAYLCTFVFVLC